MPRSIGPVTTATPRTAATASASGLGIVKSLVALVGMMVVGGVFWTLRVKAATVYPYATPERIFEGVAHLPFQYRVLTALIVRVITETCHISSVQLVFGWIDLFVTVALFMLFYYINKLFILPILGILFFIWAMMANYVYFSPVNYMEPYDMPAMLIFCAGIFAIHQRKWILFYSMLLIGMLNRETAGLLTVGFILAEYKSLPRARIILHIIAQLLIILSIRVALHWIYRNNGGVPFEFYVQQVAPGEPSPPPSHIVQNIGYVFSGQMVPLFGGIWVLLVCTLRFIKDRTLRRLMWLIPIEFGFMLVLGRITEFRLFNECVPLVALGASAGLSGFLGYVTRRDTTLRRHDRTAI